MKLGGGIAVSLKEDVTWTAPGSGSGVQVVGDVGAGEGVPGVVFEGLGDAEARLVKLVRTWGANSFVGEERVGDAVEELGVVEYLLRKYFGGGGP